MSKATNKKAINTATRVLTNQVKMLEAQGYSDLYFNAQFFSDGKKQNCVERGQVDMISKQLRNYVRSEQADTMNVELVDASSGKVIYRKKFTDLLDVDAKDSSQNNRNTSDGGLGSPHQGGLGAAEVNQLVAKQLYDARREDEIARLNKELSELSTKYSAIESEKEEIESALKAKQSIEFYSGIIGATLPGLAPLFEGTPLAKMAGLLSGPSGDQEEANNTGLATSATTAFSSGLSGDSEVQSTALMVAEFCNTLTPKEASALHTLCAAFEKDKSKLYSFVRQLSDEKPSYNNQTQQHV